MFKEILTDKVRKTLNTLALPAVLYAENLIGKGFGEKKKEIAVDFILSKLPVYLKPFKFAVKKILWELIDFIVELAVSKLHKIQEALPQTV